MGAHSIERETPAISIRGTENVYLAHHRVYHKGFRVPHIGETSHRERSGLTTTCGCLFGFVCKKRPTKLERFSREESSQRAPPFFCGGGQATDQKKRGIR